MKYILGLLVGGLLLISCEPAARAMPLAAPLGVIEFDGAIEKVMTYRRARVTTRRVHRRVYRRHY
jgi:hypothetical protein